MNKILEFSHPECDRQELTGGKGVNLSRLTKAGFVVPPGFCVPTSAYVEFITDSGIESEIKDLIKQLGSKGHDSAREIAAKIRGIIEAADMPLQLVDEIFSAYEALGECSYVAVRSSGSAEDLVDASFAGQHDTYLDVNGSENVVNAVKRCWASLLTERAVGYRERNGFNHLDVTIAVVVQRMVASDVSGVMFTGNPVTSATDEVVINATWGLGESLVSGVITPDQFIVQKKSKTNDLRVIERELGAKESRIVRDTGLNNGVKTEVVGEAERQKYTLDDTQILALSRLGLDVENYYDGFPQDIEWGMEDGIFYLLQSRPITGVEFSWDADVDAMCEQEDPIDTVWTRSFSDSIMNGIVTPSQYSTRFPQFSHRFFRKMHEDFGFSDLAEMRHHKYWKCEAYYNVRPEMEWVKRMVWPPLRPLFLDFVPAAYHEEVLNASFDLNVFINAIRRWHEVANDTTPYGFPPVFKVWNKERKDVDGMTYDQLRDLSDAELVNYCRSIMAIEGEWGDVIYAPYFATLRLAMASLWWMVGNWCEGDHYDIFSTLVAGTREKTGTQIENYGLMDLVSKIRTSPEIRRCLESFEGEAFFEKVADCDGGKDFLDHYNSWLAEFSHRGHSDRDYYYARRSEDPMIDYRAFKMMLQSDPKELELREAEVNNRREETAAAITNHLVKQENGAFKAFLFNTAHGIAMQYQEIRDDERFCPTDSLMFSYKRGAVVLGERLVARGYLSELDDVWFMADWELYGLVEGDIEMTPLLKAKIAARKRDGKRALDKTADLPMSLQRNRKVDLEDVGEELEEGVHKGSPTSSGTITGIARVLHNHNEMPRLSKGEILVTHSTDPGWNPVFSLISGVVIETGGMLSHASCLAREYGFPAVHLPNATRLIEDGAEITVDGNSGKVYLVSAG